MPGIFGEISNKKADEKNLRSIAMHSRQRGKNSSSIVYNNENYYRITRSDYDIAKVLSKEKWSDSCLVMGQSSPISDGLLNNQPVVNDGIFVIHDGIIINGKEINDIPVSGVKETKLTINKDIADKLGITLPENIIKEAVIIKGEN